MIYNRFFGLLVTILLVVVVFCSQSYAEFINIPPFVTKLKSPTSAAYITIVPGDSLDTRGLNGILGTTAKFSSVVTNEVSGTLSIMLFLDDTLIAGYRTTDRVDTSIVIWFGNKEGGIKFDPVTDSMFYSHNGTDWLSFGTGSSVIGNDSSWVQVNTDKVRPLTGTQLELGVEGTNIFATFPDSIVAGKPIKIKSPVGTSSINIRAPNIVTNLEWQFPAGMGSDGDILYTDGDSSYWAQPGAIQLPDSAWILAQVDTVRDYSGGGLFLGDGVISVLETHPDSVLIRKALRLKEASGVNSVSIVVPDVASDLTFSLPPGMGSNGQLLQSNGTLSSWWTPNYITGNQSISLSGDVGGSGTTAITTTIGADKILESMLKAVDTPTDEDILTYESTTGDFEWHTPAQLSLALTSDLHARSHTMTSTSDHTAGNWKLFYSNGSGQLIELALAASGVLLSNGATAAPSFGTVTSSNITDATVALGDMAANSVDSNKIVQQSISPGDIDSLKTFIMNNLHIITSLYVDQILARTTGVSIGTGNYIMADSSKVLFGFRPYLGRWDLPDSSLITYATAAALSGGLADNAVTEPKLKVVDTPTDEDILTYESTTGDFEWHTPAELSLLTGNQSITLSGDISGTGATAITTTIGADKVLESMLKAVDTPTDEDILTYEVTTGDFEWHTPAQLSLALTSDLHTRSHTMTSTSDHTATNWRLFYSNGSGQVVELALGTGVVIGNGATSAPTIGTATVGVGGTGATTFTSKGVLFGNTTSAIGATAQGATNTVLHGNGASNPSFSAVVSGDIQDGTIEYGDLSGTTPASGLQFRRVPFTNVHTRYGVMEDSMEVSLEGYDAGATQPYMYKTKSFGANLQDTVFLSCLLPQNVTQAESLIVIYKTSSATTTTSKIDFLSLFVTSGGGVTGSIEKLSHATDYASTSVARIQVSVASDTDFNGGEWATLKIIFEGDDTSFLNVYGAYLLCK